MPVFDVWMDSEVTIGHAMVDALRNAGCSELVFSEGGFWAYGLTYWRSFEPSFMRKIASRYNGKKAGRGGDPEKPPNVIKMSAAKVTGVVISCGDCVSDAKYFDEPADGVTLRNGFLALGDRGETRLTSHSPAHKARFMIDADYDPMNLQRYAGSPLERLFNGCWKDAIDIGERIALFQEILGAALFGLYQARRAQGFCVCR